MKTLVLSPVLLASTVFAQNSTSIEDVKKRLNVTPNEQLLRGTAVITSSQGGQQTLSLQNWQDLKPYLSNFSTITLKDVYVKHNENKTIKHLNNLTLP